jgi:hypothetical protein
MIWTVILGFKRRIVGDFSYYSWRIFGLFLCEYLWLWVLYFDLFLITWSFVNLLHGNYVLYKFLVIIYNYS